MIYSLQSGHLSSLPASLQHGLLSSLPATNFQPTATQEPDGPCGNQHYSRDDGHNIARNMLSLS